jgi:CDP-diacylglycerol---glycerol-3-phosphate 3-phosphatidyltransferase
MFDGRFRHAVDRSTKPVGAAFVRVGITADVLTFFGLAMSVVAAVVVGSGHLAAGIAMLFATGLPDLFDGPVAKAAGRASVRGAFLDSVADRVSDSFILGGVAWYLSAHHHGQAVMLPFAILAVTFLISYERAKAELLGLSAKGGLMERAERFVLLGACFVAGAVSAAAFLPALWVFLVLVTATAVGRFAKVWSAAEAPAAMPRRTSAARTRVGTRAGEIVGVAAASASGFSGPGGSTGGERRRLRAVARRRELADSRWRSWRESRAQRHGVGSRPMVPLGHRWFGEPTQRLRSRLVTSAARDSESTRRERKAARTSGPVDRPVDSEWP